MIRPAGFLLEVARDGLDLPRVVRESRRECHFRARRAVHCREDLGDHVRGLQCDPELAPRARVVRRRCEVESALAVRCALGEIFHHLGRGAHGFPVNSVVACHDQRGVEVRSGDKDFAQELRLARVVAIRKHGGADRRDETFSCDEAVVVPEKSQRLLMRQPANVFRERLRGDAQRLDLVTGLLERRLALAEHGERFADLLFIPGSIQTDESGDRPHFGFL